MIMTMMMIMFAMVSITITALHMNYNRKYMTSMTSTELPPLKKLQKIEQIKLNSQYLTYPLKDELDNDEVYLSHDAVIVMKYHGSYMQDNRDNRQKDKDKEYSFMLRLKAPAGEIPPDLYMKLDEMCDEYGQSDLRATTRQAYQLHGILKGNLKTVINNIMSSTSSTIGACGDVSRNVMTSPAPFTTPEYVYTRHYAKILAELFKPQSSIVTELWENDEKVTTIDYWLKDVKQFDPKLDIQKELMHDTGRGVILSDPIEPLYGSRYLPKKFKIAITVPEDNSLDIYTNDIGLVTIVDKENNNELLGFNVIVGGGMGRTHNKDATFARTGDHLGFVQKDDILELCKCIVAAQRDHGNREIRTNSRMKYLVDSLGVDKFRALVETYFGKSIQPWKEIPSWKYNDWMGWYDQGDGKKFLGINIEQGRIRDYNEHDTHMNFMGNLKNLKVRTAVREIVQEFKLTMILTPSQSIIFKDILPEQVDSINSILLKYNMKSIHDIDPIIRHSMACPALPLCGLAVTEAERRMPEFLLNMRQIMNKVGLDDTESMIIRMTGCPNGCARPYMAELALVGDGPEMYQIWIGGSPVLTNIAYVYKNKVKWSDMNKQIEPLFLYYKLNKDNDESFGTFCQRIGVNELLRFSNVYLSLNQEKQ